MHVQVDNDPASKAIPAQPLQGFVPSDLHFRTVKGWVNECDSNHENCPKIGSSKLPTRVIDVSLDGHEGNVCLVNQEKEVRYAALSYCWGKSNFLTTTKTLEQHMAQLPVSQLPRTIQDAIFCTRRLGIRYLWVDSLCILQDSAMDKARELSTMSETYQNAYITISAALSSDANDGFLQEREFSSAIQGWPVPFLPFRCQDGEIGTVGLLQFSSTNIRDPVSTRGWTFQEHMLSPRLLIYGTLEVYWSCFTQTLPELDESWEKQGASASRHARGLLLHARRVLRGPDPESEDDEKYRVERWEELVEEYSCRALTYPRDKLPAFSAIAATFNNSSDKYIAGLWSRWFFRLLIWKSKSPEDAVRLAGVAPTWSWASLAGEVEFLFHPTVPYEELVEVIECTTTLKFDFAPYGEIVNSRLIVRGQLELTPADLRDKALRAASTSSDELACLDSLREDESANEPLYSMPVFSMPIFSETSYKTGYQTIGLLLRGTRQKLRRAGVYKIPNDYLYLPDKSEIVELI